jgi:hypothetical protein
LPWPKDACDNDTVTDLRKILNEIDGMNRVNMVEALAACAKLFGKWVIKIPDIYSSVMTACSLDLYV